MPDGRAANHANSVWTFRPPIAAPLPGACDSFAVTGSPASSLADTASPDSFEKGLATLEENLKGERAFVANLQSAVSRVRRPGSEEQFRWDRGERIYDVTVGALTLAGDAGYVVLFHDETQQTRFEETQELARRYLEDILNNIQLGVVVLNREMRITNMNRAQEAFLHRLGTWTS